jgi:hypothetical protein
MQTTAFISSDRVQQQYVERQFWNYAIKELIIDVAL